MSDDGELVETEGQSGPPPRPQPAPAQLEGDWISDILDKVITFIPDTLETLGKIFHKFVPTYNDRYIAKLVPIVDDINSLEEKMKALSDADLKALTPAFRARLEKGEALDDLLPEAFAAVREASRRVTGLRHFDVQMMGGIVLHRGNISEMKTGEGKTLVATLPLYLNALEQKGCCLVTVNDYLARRDASWMGPIYHALGLTVGVIQHELSFQFDPEVAEDPAASGIAHLRQISRHAAYRCDITYGTNNEFGFDYLRDNMAISLDDQSQRHPLNFAIVDEVDSILIDEARTPLIISGPAEQAEDLYQRFSDITSRLIRDEDYTVDEKAHTVISTEEGITKVERMVGVHNLYEPGNIKLVHHLHAALKGKELFKRDKDYVVDRGQVIIVDEFTGRLMPGRRWSDGIHQAVEAKEGLKVQREYQTLATITFQNYFRLYQKLAGMTGTAETEKKEFLDIYGLEVFVVPTNVPMVREDLPDVIYRSQDEKYDAIIYRIRELFELGEPVLVGTISIEKSEMISARLKGMGVPHQVLNAKYHQKEAEIIAGAGNFQSVMIATNMAGRGTDIKLDTKAKELGGLYIIGTERHESRRIDNQLRGRSGRQGDPGCTQFYLSMEDDLMRLFGGPKIRMWMETLGWEKGEPIEHRMVSNSIEKAQKRVELEHFEMRKHILKYDDVMNEQRNIIYGQRQKALSGESIKEDVLKIFEDIVIQIVEMYMPDDVGPGDWDAEEMSAKIHDVFGVLIDVKKVSVLARPEATAAILEQVKAAYAQREEQIGPPTLRRFEKFVLLQLVDEAWKDHLYGMDHIKEGIHWEGYAGKDPLVQYKLLARDTFNEMIGSIKERLCRNLFRIQLERPPEQVEAVITQQEQQAKKELVYGPVGAASSGEERKPAPKRAQGAPGRNDPCPCGSGKKYKKCHGR